MKRLTCVMIGLLVVLVTFISAQVNVAAPSSIAVHDIVESGTTRSILQKLAEEHHVVIGVYGTIAGTDDPTINISVKNGSLSDVLDTIPKADSRFDWEQSSNGNIHFVTRGAPNALMDVMMHSFEDTNPRVLDFTGHLLRVPEIHGWLQEHKCDMIHRIFIAGQPLQPTIRMSFTFSQALRRPPEVT
jgi:hypothetical protein